MNRRNVTAYALLVFAAAGLTLALAYPAASDSPWDPPIGANEPAHFNGAWYDCWNAHGYPLPQADPICPEGWAGRAPENPLPVDFTQAAPPPIARPAVISEDEGQRGKRARPVLKPEPSPSETGAGVPRDDGEGIDRFGGAVATVASPSSPGALPDTGGRP
jgi:hypothetical protein